MEITKDISIEDLVNQKVDSVRYLADRGRSRRVRANDRKVK